MLRRQRATFEDFRAPFGAAANEIAENISPLSMSQLKACITLIMKGQVDYFVDDSVNPDYGPACYCWFPEPRLAIFFNKLKGDVFELVDAERQP